MRSIGSVLDCFTGSSPQGAAVDASKQHGRERSRLARRASRNACARLAADPREPHAAGHPGDRRTLDGPSRRQPLAAATLALNLTFTFNLLLLGLLIASSPMMATALGQPSTRFGMFVGPSAPACG